MRIALYITPLSELNMRLAVQVGVEEVVGLYPGPDLDELTALKSLFETAGLRLSVIESEKFR